jgi:hypothetical protein
MPTPPWFKSSRKSRLIAALLLCAGIALLGGLVYGPMAVGQGSASHSGAVLAAATPPPPPTPSITSGPASPTSSNSATFAFVEHGAPQDSDNDHDTDAVTFHCSLDGSSYATCASPHSYTKLADGSHTFRVTAQQESTSQSAPASSAWIVSTHPPTVVLNFTANGGLYNGASWNAGCSPVGYCGSAVDPVGVTQVQLSIQRQSTGKYWTGSAFSGSSQSFVTTTLNHPGAHSTQWAYSFGILQFPGDGKYSISLWASDSVGNQTRPQDQVKATFTIDTTPPPAPVITQHPTNPTTSTSATLAFHDTESKVTLRCSLDGVAYSGCTSPKSYSGLAGGSHQFAVIACDAAGNCSSATTFTWTVSTSNAPFGISGNAVGTFYPGASSLPINLVIANPFNSTLTVTSATVTVTSTNKTGCDTSNFAVVQNLVGSVNIPANTTESLSTAGDPQSNWPSVRMVETNTNQDACEGATVTFSYAGSGTHN